MPRKIGRNDPCPCGSKLKFKKCCINEYPDEKLYYEKDVLSEALQESKKFNKYFKEKRNKISNKLVWSLKRNEKPHIKCRYGTKLNGNHIIKLKEIPPKGIKPSIIAHEIEHIILIEEGYPLAFPTNPAINYTSYLNSLLQDPIVYQRLGEFEFDVRGDYIENVEQFLNELGAFNKPKEKPSEHLAETMWILTYVQTNLIMETITYEKDAVGFNSFFDKQYEEIAKKGKELIGEIHGIGFSTIKEQDKLAQHIIDKYDLDKLLFVKNF